jgi:hypothetical protein
LPFRRYLKSERMNAIYGCHISLSILLSIRYLLSAHKSLDRFLRDIISTLDLKVEELYCSETVVPS